MIALFVSGIGLLLSLNVPGASLVVSRHVGALRKLSSSISHDSSGSMCLMLCFGDRLSRIDRLDRF